MNNSYIFIILGILYVTPIVFLTLWIKKQTKANTYLINQLSNYTTQNLTNKINDTNSKLERLIKEDNLRFNSYENFNKSISSKIFDIESQLKKNVDSNTILFNTTNRYIEMYAKDNLAQVRNYQDNINEFSEMNKTFYNKLIAIESSQTNSFNSILSILSELKKMNLQLDENSDNHHSAIEKRLLHIEELHNTYKSTVKELLQSTISRDDFIEKQILSLSDNALKIDDTSKGIFDMTEMIYKDFDLLVELLKAGLMNDLIRDIKKHAGISGN